MSDNLILFDWFSFTSKVDSWVTITEMLGIDSVHFQPVKGARGYLNRAYFDGISIHYGGRDEVWVEMSGQGCRNFETNGHGNWEALFECVSGDRDYHVTRLDVAFDDHTGLLDIDRLYLDTYDGCFKSKYQYWEVTASSDGKSIYHGSPRSDLRFRIYDKAAERKRVGEHWIRFEMQLRDDRAQQFIDQLLLKPVGEIFFGVLRNYLNYYDRTNDTNKSRWKMAEWWQAFTGIGEQIPLYSCVGTEYNLEKLEHFSIDMSGAAAATYIKINGVEKYLDKINRKYEQSRNPNYQDLVYKTSLNGSQFTDKEGSR